MVNTFSLKIYARILSGIIHFYSTPSQYISCSITIQCTVYIEFGKVLLVVYKNYKMLRSFLDEMEMIYCLLY
jgi:hypothetical protein